MGPNPLLKRLGLAETDRAAIIHVDDIGMCEASLAAFSDLTDFGLVSSGAVMVPCPWFPAAAAYCRTHPGIDMGVHLTLNSEWEMLRWGPVSTRDSASGLIDSEGYLYRTSVEVHQHADPAAVQVEIEAQVKRALAAGIDATHVDTHMGTVVGPRFMNSYLQVAAQFHLPAFVARMEVAALKQRLGMDSEAAQRAEEMIIGLEVRGVPTLDYLAMMPLDKPANRIEQAKQMLSELKPGVTHFIIHAAKDTPELRALATTDWPSRVADYETFTSEAMRSFIRDSGILLIGYRAIRDVYRASAG
jgi:chitin disaccharide deacetylase